MFCFTGLKKQSLNTVLQVPAYIQCFVLQELKKRSLNTVLQLPAYIQCFVLQELKKRDIKEVVRVCEPTYDTKLLEQEGLQVLVSIHQFMYLY